MLFAHDRTTSGSPSYPSAEVSAMLNSEYRVKSGVHDWEWQNLAAFNHGQLNEAELGMANLKKAMGDQSLLKEVAEWLRHPDGRAQLIELMASQKFRAEAKAAAEQMKKEGEL